LNRGKEAQKLVDQYLSTLNVHMIADNKKEIPKKLVVEASCHLVEKCWKDLNNHAKSKGVKLVRESLNKSQLAEIPEKKRRKGKMYNIMVIVPKRHFELLEISKKENESQIQTIFSRSSSLKSLGSKSNGDSNIVKVNSISSSSSDKLNKVVDSTNSSNGSTKSNGSIRKIATTAILNSIDTNSIDTNDVERIESPSKRRKPSTLE